MSGPPPKKGNQVRKDCLCDPCWIQANPPAPPSEPEPYEPQGQTQNNSCRGVQMKQSTLTSKPPPSQRKSQEEKSKKTSVQAPENKPKTVSFFFCVCV